MYACTPACQKKASNFIIDSCKPLTPENELRTSEPSLQPFTVLLKLKV